MFLVFKNNYVNQNADHLLSYLQYVYIKEDVWGVMWRSKIVTVYVF